MGFLAEDLEAVIKTADFSNLKRRPPVSIGGDYSEKNMPFEGIFIDDEDIDTLEGSSAKGEIIYEKQSCTVRAWTTNRPDRLLLKKDLIAILEAFPRSMINSILPLDFMEKHGIQISVRRLET